MSRQLIYLDHNATAPVRPEVVTAMVDAMRAGGNPSSVHTVGQGARGRVERAREQVAALARADAGEVTFTSGGTEANYLALRGGLPDGRRLYMSAIEHDSVVQAAPRNVRVIPVLPSGVTDLVALEEMLERDDGVALVSVMLANNETGVIQPVAEISRLAHAHGALTHCDAIQAAGKIPIDRDLLDVDMLSLSAHKIGGPQGVGALIVRRGVDIAPLQRGGGQERGLRGGTENVPGIVGFGVAAELAMAGLPNMAAVARLRDRLEADIVRATPEAVFFGAQAERLPNTSCFALPGAPGETQVMRLDLASVAISAGSACSSGKAKRSPVLAAMCVDDSLASCAVRVSLGWDTSTDDVDAFLAAWVPAGGARKMRQAG